MTIISESDVNFTSLFKNHDTFLITLYLFHAPQFISQITLTTGSDESSVSSLSIPWEIYYFPRLTPIFLIRQQYVPLA